MFYIDLDHFKDVNDTLGHPVGDELIRNVTLRLSHIMRGDDLVARLGGDEFAVITAASSDHAALHEIASRMIATLCAPYSVSGHTIVIGASIGIAVIDQRSGGAADIMRYADMALYRAKNEGRNRACIYDAVMDADLSQRKLVEQDLRETIENDGLKVLYQPIFNASGDKVVGVEALARWPHPTRGLIPPTEFIPIAEHSGLIIELGAKVLRRACLDGMAWPGITVSVNVSPLQFRRLDFVSMVERILAETGFDPKRLELELTETTLLGNVESAEAAMLRLKALGVQLALDDFGTGYSSLLYLRRFPFDKLKIDRSFVLSIEKAADAAAIVHAVVSLGRGLGMKVTAEGVETAEQHLFLRAAGVHYMQGFRFGRPTEPAEIATRIATPGVYRSIEGDAKAALAAELIETSRNVVSRILIFDRSPGDDRPPARHLAFDVALVFRRARQRLELERAGDQKLLVRLVGAQLEVGGRDRFDDLLRHAGRREDADEIRRHQIGKPCSTAVGNSGAAARRLPCVTASTRSLPAR